MAEITHGQDIFHPFVFLYYQCKAVSAIWAFSQELKKDFQKWISVCQYFQRGVEKHYGLNDLLSLVSKTMCHTQNWMLRRASNDLSDLQIQTAKCHYRKGVLWQKVWGLLHVDQVGNWTISSPAECRLHSFLILPIS